MKKKSLLLKLVWSSNAAPVTAPPSTARPATAPPDVANAKKVKLKGADDSPAVKNSESSDKADSSTSGEENDGEDVDPPDGEDRDDDLIKPGVPFPNHDLPDLSES